MANNYDVRNKLRDEYIYVNKIVVLIQFHITTPTNYQKSQHLGKL
jgi:hypothetical protein